MYPIYNNSVVNSFGQYNRRHTILINKKKVERFHMEIILHPKENTTHISNLDR